MGGHGEVLERPVEGHVANGLPLDEGPHLVAGGRSDVRGGVLVVQPVESLREIAGVHFIREFNANNNNTVVDV